MKHLCFFETRGQSGALARDLRLSKADSFNHCTFAPDQSCLKCIGRHYLSNPNAFLRIEYISDSSSKTFQAPISTVFFLMLSHNITKVEDERFEKLQHYLMHYARFTS